jgi:hypothetical protein
MNVLLFKGMKTGGEFSMSLDESGQLNANFALSTAYNVIPLWLRVAMNRLNDAKSASENIVSKWGCDADIQKTLLVAELAPSMEVIVSCGIALDSLYDMLRPYAKISEEEIDRWREKRTGRGVQISAVVGRVLKPGNKQAKEISESITEIVKLRDMAVHPTLHLKSAQPRSDLGVAVDWKFAVYRFTSAQMCFDATMRILLFARQQKNLDQRLSLDFNNIFEALEELGVV